MTLRVLHVVATTNRRGGELFASDLVRALDGEGIEQQVAVLHPPIGLARVGFEAPTVAVGDGWRAPGVRMSLEAFQALRHLVSGWRPHVVQAHGGEPFKYLVASGAAGRSKLVYRRIGAAPPWILRGPRRAAHAVLMRRATKVVAVAEAVRRETLEVFGVPPANVRMIPNGVDPARLSPLHDRQATRKALGIASDAPVILSLGALTWEKDPLGHLRISGEVMRHQPRAIHLFVGEGPLRERAEERVRSERRGEHVRFLGSREDLPDLLAASDVLLLASAVEGMPAGAIEAGIAGLPVVGYHIAGVPEVVLDGVTGQLVPAGDPFELAHAVIDLLANEPMRRSMGDAAAERCRSLFGIDAVAPRYLDLYQELVQT
jgi:glycosyltransferase involved in cell wall biosynthesis